MSDAEGYSISSQQRRLWTHAQSGPYFGVFSQEIKGALDVSVLRRGLAQLVAAHEILTTRFVVPSGLTVPLQVVAEETDYVWEEIDAGITPEQLGRRAAENDSGPPLHVSLVRGGQDSWTLFFALPALCCDDRTLALLGRELWECYSQVDDLPEIEAVQYAEYADWLGELAREDEGGKTFWIECQRGFQEGEAPGACQPVWPDGQAVCADENLLLSCWLLLLSGLRGCDSAVIGVDSAGRSFEELNEAAGPFSRLLPIQFQLSRSETPTEILAAVSHRLEEVRKWQDYYGLDSPSPFIVDHGFRYRKQEKPPALPNLSLQSPNIVYWNEPLSLMLDVVEQEGLAHWRIAFDANRQEHSEVQALARRLHALIHLFTEKPQGANTLCLLLPEEQTQLVEAFNATVRPPRWSIPIHQLFEQGADQHPEQTAVVAQGCSLSFSDLNNRANRLAHLLIKRGVGAEIPVALIFARSADAVVATLAVLKAGGTYVAMDPHLPQERLTFQLQDSGARLVLSESILAQPSWNALLLDKMSLAHYPDQNPRVKIQLHQTAYTLYTSGSSGQPKAVLVTHANLLNYLDGISQRLELEENASYALVSTLAADLGHTMLLPALGLSGTLHLMSQDCIQDGMMMADYMQSHSVDHLKITPSHLAALLHQDHPVLPAKALVLGGEATPSQLLTRLRQMAPNLGLFNHYGPSETTVGVLCIRDDGSRNGLPLGRPLANSSIYLLNSAMTPVPQATPGELFIGGANVSRGYRNQPALTASRFVPDPFSDQAGARLYRTGDLACFDEEALPRFMGRLDHQIKVRGYRVELGEIETLLNRHEDVRESLVVPWDGEMLVAYLVARSVSTDVLREYLSLRLPEYMMPASFVHLDKIPLTPNGKVDRQALPAPSQNRPYQAPRNSLEAELTALWEELIGHEQIGISDDFFELGGHSLLMVQLTSQIETRFKKRVSIAELGKHTTVKRLAAFLEQDDMPCSPIVALGHPGTQIPWFCVHPIGGQVHWYYATARALARPFYALQAPGLMDEQLICQDIPQIAANYIKACREVVPHGPYLLAGWSMGGSIAFEMAQQLTAVGERVADLVLIDALRAREVNVHAAEDQLTTALGLLQDMLQPSGFDREVWRARLLAHHPDQWARLTFTALSEHREGLDQSWVERAYGVYAAHETALKNYEPEAYSGPVSLVRASDTVRAFASKFGEDIATFGWASLCSVGMWVYDLDGSHEGIWSSGLAPVLRQIGERV